MSNWLDRWDHMEPEYERECPDCEELKKRLDQAKDFIEGIFDMLSNKDPYDGLLLESYLEELSDALGTHVSMGSLNSQHKISA